MVEKKKKLKKLITKNKVKKINVVKIQPLQKPKIKSKSRKKDQEEDDDIVGLPAMELEDEVDISSVEVSDDEVVEDVEVVGGTESLESIEGSETFSLGGSADEGSKLEVIRSNPKPRAGWSDTVTPKFSPGDLVVPIELTKKESLEFEPYKIVCTDIRIETYTIKKSRILAESIIYSDEVKLAPKNGKPFISHWDATNPFKVPGVKISCPSNDRK